MKYDGGKNLFSRVIPMGTVTFRDAQSLDQIHSCRSTTAHSRSTSSSHKYSLPIGLLHFILFIYLLFYVIDVLVYLFSYSFIYLFIYLYIIYFIYLFSYVFIRFRFCINQENLPGLGNTILGCS